MPNIHWYYWSLKPTSYIKIWRSTQAYRHLFEKNKSLSYSISSIQNISSSNNPLLLYYLLGRVVGCLVAILNLTKNENTKNVSSCIILIHCSNIIILEKNRTDQHYYAREEFHKLDIFLSCLSCLFFMFFWCVLYEIRKKWNLPWPFVIYSRENSIY